MSCKNIWLLCRVYQFGSRLYLFLFWNIPWSIANNLITRLILKRLRHKIGLGGASNIQQNGTRATRLGNVKRFCHDFGNFISINNLIIPLGYGHRHSDNITLLKSIRSQKVCLYLPDQTHHRRRVQKGIGNGSHQIGSPWSRCYHRHPRPTRHASVTLCSVSSTLFVANQNVFNSILIVVKGIVSRHNCPAWVAKNSFYVILYQTLHDSLSPRQELLGFNGSGLLSHGFSIFHW